MSTVHYMLTLEMLTFMYAYNQTRLIPDTINRRIHTHRVECKAARKLYTLCFLSSFSLFISIVCKNYLFFVVFRVFHYLMTISIIYP